jgi:hypothetical protein
VGPRARRPKDQGEANDNEREVLAESLRASMVTRTTLLGSLEREVRLIVDAMASLIGSMTRERATKANLSLQRQGAFLIWVATDLAAVTLLPPSSTPAALLAPSSEIRLPLHLARPPAIR